MSGGGGGGGKSIPFLQHFELEAKLYVDILIESEGDSYFLTQCYPRPSEYLRAYLRRERPVN